MSNFQKKGWCRFCQATINHSWENDTPYPGSCLVICGNCGRGTPEKAFLRYDKRRKDFIKKLKK
jgi:hypothetical protein